MMGGLVHRWILLVRWKSVRAVLETATSAVTTPHVACANPCAS
jgi:hypothetical protein